MRSSRSTRLVLIVLPEGTFGNSGMMIGDFYVLHASALGRSLSGSLRGRPRFQSTATALVAGQTSRKMSGGKVDVLRHHDATLKVTELISTTIIRRRIVCTCRAMGAPETSIIRGGGVHILWAVQCTLKAPRVSLLTSTHFIYTPFSRQP